MAFFKVYIISCTEKAALVEKAIVQHTKDEFPKFLGHLMVSAAKENLIGDMSMFQ